MAAATDQHLVFGDGDFAPRRTGQLSRAEYLAGVVLSQVLPDLNVTLLYGNIVLVFVILSAGLDIAILIGLPTSLDTDSNILDRIVGIMVLVLAFQVRNGFNLLLQARRGDALWFSGVYTWLISVVYLQYKLNKIIQQRQTEMQFPTIG